MPRLFLLQQSNFDSGQSKKNASDLCLICAAKGNARAQTTLTSAAVGSYRIGIISKLSDAELLDRAARPLQPRLQPHWVMVTKFQTRDISTAFADDWTTLALDKAKHFKLLRQRLHKKDCSYDAFPGQDGLWEAAANTSLSLLSRLALVPIVLEARALHTKLTAIDPLAN